MAMSFSRYRNDYRYQVFISYSISDRDWVINHLLPELLAVPDLHIENSPGQDYQASVDCLVRRLRNDALHNAALQADLDHASIYQQRLGENITEKEKHGDNETLRSTRSQIL